MKIFLLLLFLFNSTLYAVQNEAVAIQDSQQKINFSKEEKQWLKDNPSIKIALMSYWKYDSDGNNIHTDVLKLLSKYSNLNIMPVKLNNWKDGFDQASKGENVHGLMHLSWSKEREENSFFYTTAYTYKPNYLIVREENSDINSLKDLENRTILLKEESITHSIIEATNYNIKVIDVDADDKMFKKLSNSKNVSALVSYNANKKMLEKYNLKIAKTLYDKHSAISLGVSHQHPQLHSIINKIYKIIPTNELMALQNKIYKTTSDKQLHLTEKEKKWLNNNPLIKIALMSFWKYDNNGNNIHTDIIKLLNKYSDLNIIPVKFDTWKEGFVKASSGEYIHGITNLNWSKAREKENFFYTKPYTFKSSYLVVRKGNNTVKSLKDLEKKTIYLQAQTITAKTIHDNVKEIKVIEVDNDKELYEKLSTSQEAVAFLAYGVSKEKLDKYNLKIAKTVYDKYSDVSIGVSHQQPILNSIINKIYEIIPANELTALQDKKYLNKKIQLTTKEKKWIEDHPVIRFVSDPSWEPFEFIENGIYKGISSSYLKLISEKTGLSFKQTKVENWADGIKKVKNKQSDMCSCVKETKKRKSFIKFTKPYLTYPVVMVTKQDKPFLDTIDELNNKKVVVIKEYAMTELLETKHPKLKLIYVDNITQALQAVSNNNAYAFISMLPTASYSINKEGFFDLKISGKTKYKFPLSIGLRNDWDSTGIEIINKALDSITPDEKKIIYNKWVGITFEEKVNYTIIWQILFVVFIILMIVFYWIRKISKINEKILQLNKKLQHQKNQLKKETEKANLATKAKSIFLSNMSHEIRTPMNAILGFSELLNDEVNDKRLKSYLKTIISSGNTLLILINDILDLSKIESGKLEIIKKNTHVRDLFEESVNIFMIQAENKGLKLTLEIDENIPKALLLDPVRVKEILINLIGNAMKFTDKGGIDVRIYLNNKLNHNDTLNIVIEVEDSGIGISEKNIKKIFNSFEQTEKQDTRKYGGTGLGLSISKKLSIAMDGSLHVESEFGAGSKFVVHLNNIETASKSDEINIKKLDYKNIEFSNETILVVDDVDENRFLIKENLYLSNLNILEASDGEKAVELAKENNIDLILMDIRMPVMNGYTATGLIREFNGDVPIIALTASIMQKELDKLESQSFNGYVKKPVSRQELFDTLTTYLNFSEGDNIEEKSTQVYEDEVEITEIKELDEFLSVLRDDISVKYHKAKSTNNMSMITLFANSLLELSQKHDVTILIKYSQTILDHINAFDIGAIGLMMNDYEKVVKKISAHN